jgi:phage major head subunit gpT-like protein
MTTATWGRLLDPGIRKVFYRHLNEIKPKYKQFFSILNSSRASEQDLTGVGLDDWKLTQETKASQYSETIQGFTKNYVHNEWTSGLKISKKMWDDDQYNVIQRMPRQLAETAMRTIEKEAAKVFINAFNTNVYTGADGAALCSSSHTREDGGSNLSNTATGVLNYDNLETAKVDMMEELDGRGQLIQLNPNTLLVPPALEKEALTLVGSSGKPSSADNDINVYEGKFRVVVWERIGAAAGGSDTAWFLLDSSQITSGSGLNVFMRINPFIERENETETHVNKWIGYMRFSVGFTDWRGVYGSTGAGS